MATLKDLLVAGPTRLIGKLFVNDATLVTNLNADMLDGKHASEFALASALGSYLPLAGGRMTGAGPIEFTEGKIALEFRPTAASYYSRVQYMTNGNEALVFSNANSVTSFIFKSGHTLVDGTGWNSVFSTTNRPSVQIKGQSLYVNEFINTGVTPSYNFFVNGTSLFKGNVTIDSSSIGGADHLIFNRPNSYSYIRVPNNSTLALISASSVSDAGFALGIKNSLVYPGTGNTVDLGNSTYYWKNIYGQYGIFNGSARAKVYYIGHQTDTATFGGSIRGSITYLTHVNTNVVAQTSHGNGIYIAASSVADYSRITLSTLSGIFLDGSVNLSNQLISHVAQGTAPFVIDSSTAISNLNADLLDGLHSSNFVRLYTYSIPAARGVRITYSAYNSCYINCCRGNGGGQLVLIGTGYGAEGTIRNRFTEIVSCSESLFTWSLPNSTSIYCSVEIMNHSTSGNATVCVHSSGNVVFTEIAALTTEKMNATLLTTNNYSSYLGYIGTTGVRATSAAGQNMTGIGTIYIQGTSSSFCEGIRIKPYSSWSTILLGGNDLSADSGTSANSWAILNNNGSFYINKNGSSGATGVQLCNVSGNWGLGTSTPKTKFHVSGGQVEFNSSGTGASTITTAVSGLFIGPTAQRVGTAGNYSSGIGFSHMLNYSTSWTNNSIQGWIGLRLTSTSGSELGALVLATKSGTESTDIPTERMCILPDGKVGVNIKAPTEQLDVSGITNSTSYKVKGTATIVYNASTGCLEINT